MTYSKANLSNYTLVDNLPDLEELEKIGPKQQQISTKNNIHVSKYPDMDFEENPQVKKFIRQIHKENYKESGMNINSNTNPIIYPNLNPNIYPNLNTNPNLNPNLNTNPNLNPIIYPNTNPNMLINENQNNNINVKDVKDVWDNNNYSEFYSDKNTNNSLNSQYTTPNEYLPITTKPNCIDCNEHISNCPICSKFYKNDKIIYIIAIVILAIICILLLKRVLDL